jgi:hypothetical protein
MSIFSSVQSFFQGQSVICPFCFQENRYAKKIDNCLKCKLPLPTQYVNNYMQALPFFVQLIGWSRVGKTVYLQSLSLMLKKMERFWGNNYVCSPLTESTRDFMKNVAIYEAEGKMPMPNQVKLHDAYIMLLRGMERWGGRTLVTRDVAGESFTGLNFPLEYMPYLVHVPTSLMMISLSNLREDKSLPVDDLMNSYVDTLAIHKKNYRSAKLNLIVVLSKADKFKSELPDDLREYLERDPFDIRMNRDQFVDSNFMDNYMRDVYNTSERIQRWFAAKQPGGNMFLSQAKREGISLTFTIISSTGADPGPNATMLSNINPQRVLDPYFLALDFYSKDNG